MDTNDWRAQLQPNSRKRTLNQMMNTLKTLKIHHCLHEEEELPEFRKFVQNFEEKTFAGATSQSDYLHKISLKMGSLERQNQEVYPKIQSLKKMYLPELSEMDQKIAAKIEELDSLPQQPKPDQLGKLKRFKTMLERKIAFLEVSENNILPNFKEKLGRYEEQIRHFIKLNQLRNAMS